MYRTHTCGALNKQHIGETVTLSGWVKVRRDLGGLIFINLRDKSGVTQLVIDPEKEPAVHKIAETLRAEWVIKVTGVVVARVAGQENKEMSTGEIEVQVSDIEILSKAEVPPFEIDKGDVREELRLEYRYLDLRTERMQRNLQLRHDLVRDIRQHFYGADYTEVETPIMVKGTPEGSREYLVPSRMHPGSFYVLPQSPQQLKQLLMVGGLDKYFQVARCFRDEDLRGDRQPEFTQFEIEASFVSQADVMNVFEDCFVKLTEKHAPQKEWKKFLVDGQFKQITWQEAMEKYGSDKPDIRFGLEFENITDISRTSGFGVFESAETVFAMKIPASLGTFSRKDIDAFTEEAKKNGAMGLAWYRVDEAAGPVAKNTNDDFKQALKEQTKAESGDLVLFGAGEFLKAVEPLGAVRLMVADRLGLRNQNEFAYLWVVDFPMFEMKEDGTRQAAHHPFTAPHPDDVDLLDTNPMQCRALAYDLVMNGIELGGGSIRIHDRDLQYKMFEILGMDDAEIQMKFGHILKAFSYGVPPHGGAAMGLDRVVMLFADEPNIREVIAFPKNQSGQDLMLGSPAPMPEKEVSEQNIKVINVE
ncbi:aspartate--tRNA ligase [bacterium DOLZORAL124_38_8]|nr:MAG: aspartate--tRNA ligase [bacterium DOLZORAL124_38_8]